MFLRIFQFWFLLFITGMCEAQNTASINNKSVKQRTFININTHVGTHLPAVDLASRFGNNLAVGGGVELIQIPKGWIVNADVSYFFGQKVKEDVLKPMRTTEGTILGDIGTYAAVELRQRGISMSINAGKLFPLFDNGNRTGGIRLTIGSGFLQHKIRIQDNTNSAPQVTPPYSAGYDRLTNGWSLTQFIGYQVISRDKTVNFFIGLDFVEGFTRNQRGYNFDTRQTDNQKRKDILYGIKLGWSLPLWTSQKVEELEY